MASWSAPNGQIQPQKKPLAATAVSTTAPARTRFEACVCGMYVPPEMIQRYAPSKPPNGQDDTARFGKDKSLRDNK
jgi:hypothetical protein